MMLPLSVGAWSFVAGGIFLVAFAAGTPVDISAPTPPRDRAVLRSPASVAYAADSLARQAIARNPFRVDRRPARVAYDPVRAATPPAPQPPKPVLVLAGIVWGADPTALIEGLPGIEGSRVVRVGEVVGAFTVRAIERDRVTVTGMDTTWTLQVKEPWRQ
jgi:hypothetical protein